jgi:hypothetical protein
MVSQTEQKSANPWLNARLIHGLVDFYYVWLTISECLRCALPCLTLDMVSQPPNITLDIVSQTGQKSSNPWISVWCAHGLVSHVP